MFHYIHEILDVNIEYSLKLMSKQLELQRYSDFNWDEDLNTRKLTSEYVFQLTNESVSWSIKHQKIVALLFCKVKYITLTEITKAVWM
jgi:hypothetical protein